MKKSFLIEQQRGGIHFWGRAAYIAEMAYDVSPIIAIPAEEPTRHRDRVVAEKFGRHVLAHAHDVHIPRVHDGLEVLEARVRSQDKPRDKELYESASHRLGYGVIMPHIFKGTITEGVAQEIRRVRMNVLEVVHQDEGERLSSAAEALAKTVNWYIIHKSIQQQG